MKTFKDLVVWQKAHRLVLHVYRVTKSFPNEERYGLISQARRASVSVPANIAEGFKRNSTKDYLHYLNVAESSLEETKYHLLLSRDLAYLSEVDYSLLVQHCEEVGKLLDGLQKKLKTKSNPSFT